MSDTPLTDAAMCVLHPGVQPSTWYVQAEKCREIERALAAERAAHEATKAEASGQIEHLDRENNRLRAELAACRAELRAVAMDAYQGVDVYSKQSKVREILHKYVQEVMTDAAKEPSDAG